MVPERWRRILELLEAALEQAPGDREAFLDEHCGSDAELRGQVEDLLAADGEADGFLREPLVPEYAPKPRSEVLESPRDFVGPYQLLRRIGQGGMSMVYLAVRGDDEYQRRVAVKIVRQGWEGEERLHRFRIERQILASLEHPSIARLYDGGTTAGGAPYFVMEYVEGLPIDEYCDHYGLAVRERLDLFRAVCAAVHYAHQNLVVHRDLKPSNILVNADGVPKLLDFGIAKLLNPELSSLHPEPTATWVRMMTPHYASPEQVRGKMITTASDVYSLGVLLYQLLTGHLPHRFDERSPREVEQLLTEVEATPPSAAVGRDEKRTVNAAQRPACGLRPEQLRRRLSGDLDTIVLMALRKEPQRRYGSAQQFSEDVRRHLEGLPVMARKATLGYRVRKYLRRNRLATAVATLFAALILGFVVAMAMQSARIARERDEARRERDKIKQVVAFVEDIFQEADPRVARGKSTTPREMLDRSAARLDELRDQPDVQATLMNTLGNLYWNLGLYEQSEPLLRAALEKRRQVLGPEHPDLAESLHDLGLLLIKKGQYDEAETLLRQALEMRRKLLGEKHLDVAGSLNDVAVALRRKGNYDEAQTLFGQALALQRQLMGEAHPDVATSLSNLGAVLSDLGDYERAEQRHRQALALRRQLFGQEHPDVAQSLNNLAVLQYARGDYDEAQALCRQALAIQRVVFGEEHPEVANSLHNLAAILHRKGDYDEAETVFREALALTRRLDGEEHPHVASTLSNLAAVVYDQGDYVGAETLSREALALYLRVLGEEHPEVANSVANLAKVLHKKGDIEEAERLQRQALALRRRSLGEEHPLVATTLANLAAMLIDKDNDPDAESLLHEALAIQRRALDAEHPDLASTLMQLGVLLTIQGDPTAAEPLLREGLGIRLKKLPGHWLVADAESALGDCLTRQQRFAEAEALLLRSYSSIQEWHGEHDPKTLQARDRLMALYRAWNKPDGLAEYEATLANLRAR